MPLFTGSHKCPDCGKRQDNFGRHDMCCKVASGARDFTSEEGYINNSKNPIIVQIRSSRETSTSNLSGINLITSEPATTIFEEYSSFTEEIVLTDQTCLEFNQDLIKPYPQFALYPTECIDTLKNWVSLGILA
jgi:hypothetical protein